MVVLASGLMTATAAAQPLHRLVIVVAQPGDPRAVRQHAALALEAAALRLRDVLVRDTTPEAARRERPDLGVGSQVAFEVLLVGKDGTVKLRSDKPVAASEINALIDTMPMRQEEMRR